MRGRISGQTFVGMLLTGLAIGIFTGDLALWTAVGVALGAALGGAHGRQKELEK